jgi:O-acetylserine/cysteine efflux transporter
MTAARRFDARDLFVALVINLVWGLNIIAVKLSVQLVPPFTTGLLRQAVVLLACLPFLKVVPGRMRALTLLGALSGGLFLVLVNFSLVVSDNVGALAIAGLLGAPFSLILAIVFLGERIGPTRIFGMLLAIGGCSMLVFDPHIGDEVPGLLLTAAASFVWAIGSMIQRQLAGVPVLTIYAWIGLGGVAVLAPLAVVMEPATISGAVPIPPFAYLLIAGSAIGSTLMGQGGMAWLLQRHPVSSVIPMTLGAPVIAVIASSIVFAMPLTPVMVVGGVIAMAGVAIVTMRTAARAEGAE